MAVLHAVISARLRLLCLRTRRSTNAARGLAGISHGRPCRKLILKRSPVIRVGGEQQKANQSLTKEERKLGVETPQTVIWGGLTTDSKMFVEVKPNTCAMNGSLIKEKTF